MRNCYLIVEIEYVDYNNKKRGKIKIKQEFETPQDNLNIPLMLCIDTFYGKNYNCDIISIKVISNAVIE